MYIETSKFPLRFQPAFPVSDRVQVEPDSSGMPILGRESEIVLKRAFLVYPPRYISTYIAASFRM